MSHLSTDLDHLFQIPPAELLRRQETTFEELSAPLTSQIVLYGCGGLGQKTLTILLKHAIKPIALSDNNPALWGKQIHGIQVYPPELAAKSLGNRAVFVVTIASPGHSFTATREKLLGFGCLRVLPFFSLLWKYAKDILPYYAYEKPVYFEKRKEEIKAAFKLLADNKSRHLFIQHIRFRMIGQFDDLPTHDLDDQYFPDIFRLHENEVFIDCGAYSGDTLKVLLQRVPNAHVYAYEPDPINFKKLMDFVSTLPQLQQVQITAICAAVDSRSGTLHFAANGAAASAISPVGNIVVNAIALDDQFFKHYPSFIKMDIEGAEGAALEGARVIIQHHKPILAVCAYHRPDDLWALLLKIHSIYSEYSFFLRSYDHDGWETVLYAVDRSRLNPHTQRLPL